MRRLNKRPSGAVVISSLALVVALTGTGVAEAAVDLAKKSVGAKHVKKNAIRSKHIKKGAVKASDISSGAVTGAKVKDGSLTGADLADGSVTGADLAPGTLPEPDGLRAYGTVSRSTLALLEGAHGITGVERVSTGVYCLSLAEGVPAKDHNAVVSVEWGTSIGSDLLAMAVRNTGACGEDRLQVRTYDTSGTLTNDASFSILVP